MYIVMRLNYWADVKLEQAGPLRLPFPSSLKELGNGEIGYLSVFENYEDALKEAGNPGLIKEIRLREGKESKA